MKTIYNVIIGLTILVTNVSYGQTNPERDLLVGEWEFQLDQSFSEISNVSKSYLDSIPIQELQLIKRNYNGRRIVFDSNGAYRQIQGNGAIVKGNWTYDSELKTIEIILPNGALFEQSVVKMNQDNLVIVPKTEENVNMIINVWYFNRL